jgi:hypothetical protein
VLLTVAGLTGLSALEQPWLAEIMDAAATSAAVQLRKRGA